MNNNSNNNTPATTGGINIFSNSSTATNPNPLLVGSNTAVCIYIFIKTNIVNNNQNPQVINNNNNNANINNINNNGNNNVSNLLIGNNQNNPGNIG